MIKLIALLKRKPGMSKEEFEKRWLLEHTKLSSKIPGLRGYRINIAINHQPDGDDIEPIYDGTAELWWDSLEEMEAAFASQAGIIAGNDADQFCEVRIHIYTEENMVIPGPEYPNAQPSASGQKTGRAG
jgi:uncharacterized protein (TIGR02118 family)